VRASGEGFVCSACGKPRKLEPGTTIAGLGPTETGLTAPRRRGLRLLGGVAMALAVLGAAMATAILGTGAAGIALAIVVGSLGAFTGVRLLQRADAMERTLSDHLAENRAERARQILLERTSTVPELAEQLGTTEAEADAIATKLAAEERDGIRAELDEGVGVVRYGRKNVVPAVRVADPEAEVEDEAHATRRAERGGDER
jgi:hypothetical protein